MAIQKWSQAEQIFTPTTTTKLCILDGADPENKLISALNLFTYYLENEYVLTKAAIEAVLIGNITSHTHDQYLTAITKEMVEAVLTGTITTHQHDISDIINGVSQDDLTTHAADDSHLTTSERIFLEDLMANNCFTAENCEVLSHINFVGGDIVIDVDTVIEGNITAYNLGDPGITNYDMLSDWSNYSAGFMNNYVVAAPLLYGLYTDINTINAILPTKVDDTTQVIAGIGLSGGGALSSDVTLNLDINNLTTSSIASTDYIAYYRSGSHYKSVVSDLPFISSTRAVYTPLYNNPNATTGGGLTGGGVLTSDLYLELNISGMEAHSGNTQLSSDYFAIYDASASTHKKLSIYDTYRIDLLSTYSGSVEPASDYVMIYDNSTSSHVKVSVSTLIAETSLANRRVYGGVGIIEDPTDGYLSSDVSLRLAIDELTTQSIAGTDYVAFFRSGVAHYKDTVTNLAALMSSFTGFNLATVDSSDVDIGDSPQLIESGETITFKEGTNITLSQSGNVITITSAAGTAYTAGTGLTLATTTFNHTNSVSAQTTQGIYPITIDTEGHIDSYGTVVTSLKNPNNLILKFDTGTIENTDLYTYDGSATKTIDIQGGNAILLSKSSNIVSVNHDDTSSVSDLTAVTNTFISGITFDTYGHVLTIDTDTIDLTSVNKFLYVNIDGNSGYTWNTVNTNTTQEAETTTDTFTLVHGTKINLYCSTTPSTDSIMIEHATTTRSNTTSSVSVSESGSYTVIDSVTSDSTGHITGANTKTLNFPATYTPTAHASSHESGGSDTINHDSLTGFVANEHIDHSTVSIIAGTGLSGGGDLTTNRTLNLDISGISTSVSATNDYYTLVYDSVGGQVISKFSDINLLTVKEVDATPTVTKVDTIIFPNGTVTDNGDNSVSVVFSGTSPWTLSTHGIEYTTKDNVGIGATANSAYGLYTVIDLSGGAAGKFYNSNTGGNGLVVQAGDSASDYTFLAQNLASTTLFAVLGSGQLILTEASVPTTSPSGYGFLYGATDGKIYWKSDGGTFDLTASGGGGTPAGNNYEIQYNDSGAFGASSNLVWYNNNLGVGGGTPSYAIDVIDSTTSFVQRIRNSNSSGDGLLISGIGTTDSHYPLYISDYNISEIFSVRGDGSIYAPSLDEVQTGKVLYYNNLTGKITYGDPTGGGTGYWTANTGNGIEYTSGHVGIGTNADSNYGLEVAFSMSTDYITRLYNSSSTGLGLLIEAASSTSSNTIIRARTYTGLTRFMVQGDGAVYFSTALDQDDTTGYILYFNNSTGEVTYGTNTGGGATNLSYNSSTRTVQSDTGTDATLPLFSTTTSTAGLVPGSSGNTTRFLRGDGVWAEVAGGAGTNLGWVNGSVVGIVTSDTGDDASIPQFSTSSTNVGLVKGSSGLSSSYFLNAQGSWTIPSGTGTDLSYTTSTRLLSSSTGNDVTLPLFSTTSTNAGLVSGSNGNTSYVLKGDNSWSETEWTRTTSGDARVYPTNSSDIVAVGKTTSVSSAYIFQVLGQSYFQGYVNIQSNMNVLSSVSAASFLSGGEITAETYIGIKNSSEPVGSTGVGTLWVNNSGDLYYKWGTGSSVKLN